MENEDVKDCVTCAGYDKCSFEHRQVFIRTAMWGIVSCWHPIGTAKVWHEELEGYKEGTQEA